ncbi:hypothetical protein BDB00DRAFT_833791 [Zychaea mexicana]|uniref:uncharacterized protein n=1 Tax=Zychaea mexicana TaxID=64656 RepID=UPI0022FF3CB9|nr:uncharacterized protein BDB00DRAFT_833791 [Zychaea mexicana]KAI9491279.1 hypothetical protein BDB00DRAFT_833791 [Zychaea mexicana]
MVFQKHFCCCCCIRVNTSITMDMPIIGVDYATVADLSKSSACKCTRKWNSFF